jgi:hypothetical protein
VTALIALAGAVPVVGGCNEILGFAEGQAAPNGSGGAPTTTHAGAAAGTGGSATGGAAGAGGAPTVEPTLAWLGHLRGTGDEEIRSHDVGPSGAVAFCGPFEGTAVYEIDGNPMPPAQSVGLHDILAVKLTADGSLDWARVFSGVGDDDCSGIAFDSQARTHLTGSFQATVDVDGTALDAGSGRCGYLVALDAAGSLWRATQLEPGGDEILFGIDVDPAGTHWAAGGFRGTASFGTTTLVSSDGARAALIPAETYAGSRRLVGIGADGAADDEEQWAFAVHAATAQRILVGGRNAGTLTAGSTQAVADSNQGNGYVAELDGTGAVTRLLGLGSPGLSQVHGLASTAAGDTIVVGLFTSALSVDGTPTLTGHADWDAFVLRLDADWAPNLALGLGAAGAQDARDVAVDAEGNLYVVLNFAGTIEAGGATVTAEGVTDGLLLGLDSAGNHRFHVWFASNGEVFLGSVALHEASGRLSVAGYFESTLTVRLGEGAMAEPITSADGRDGFVAAFDRP